jgi:MFS family permease
VSLHARGRARLAWLDRFIVPRETPLAPSRWHQHYQTVVFASAVVGPLLGGWLADTFGFQVIFGASSAGRLLGILLFIWLAVRPILGARGSRPAPSPARAV